MVDPEVVDPEVVEPELVEPDETVPPELVDDVGLGGEEVPEYDPDVDAPVLLVGFGGVPCVAAGLLEL